MFELMILIFIIGYICIALEHTLHINKSATALLLGATMWVLLVYGEPQSMFAYSDFKLFLSHNPEEQISFISWITKHPLLEHLGETAEILFFLLAAMTIVELIDTYGGFSIITDKISTTKKSTLLWIICILSFFLSAVLDNMTTTIVMVTVLRKLIHRKNTRWLFVGMVVLSANAGGAWSPMGDVTTIMLWIAGKVSTINIVKGTFLPSLAAMLVPVIVLSMRLKGNVMRPKVSQTDRTSVSESQRKLIFFLGIGILLFVPIFKTVTHLPPYLGILGGLGVLWIITDLLLKKDTNVERRTRNSLTAILRKIDTSSILFFLGILMAVAALQTYGHLHMLSQSLENIPMNAPNKYYLISGVIGVFSSIVDNVPLVAAAMGMYDFPLDHYFWLLLAYTAGTGGSLLIIGSAAGVAAMGMEKIDFFWYVKQISLLALIGYISGGIVFVIQHSFV